MEPTGFAKQTIAGLIGIAILTILLVFYVPRYSLEELEEAVTIVMERSCVKGPDYRTVNLHTAVERWSLKRGYQVAGHDVGSTVRLSGAVRRVTITFSGGSGPGGLTWTVTKSGEVRPAGDDAEAFGTVFPCQ